MSGEVSELFSVGRGDVEDGERAGLDVSAAERGMIRRGGLTTCCGRWER